MLRSSTYLLLMFAALTATAQTSGHMVAPAMVNPPNSPLWIVSVNSNFDDALHGIVTKNVSKRPISSFQLGFIMSVPSACGPTEVFGSEHLLQPDRVTIVPGASVTTTDYRLAPNEIMNFGANNLAKQVHTQVAVVHVEFFDGSSWSLERDKIYDKSLMQRDGDLQCSNSSKAVLARAAVSANCAVLLRVYQKQTFQCNAATNQVCAVASDGQSCTSSFCNGGCPAQVCGAQIIGPIPPP